MGRQKATIEAVKSAANITLYPVVIPGCAKGAGPESILTIVVMDSGLALTRAPE